MFTCLFRTSIKFGRVPREHRPLQQQQQLRSQAIIPPSSRPGVKKKRAGSQPLQTAASGHLEVWELLSSLHWAFFFSKGTTFIVVLQLLSPFCFGRRVDLLAVVWSATVGNQIFYFMSLRFRLPLLFRECVVTRSSSSDAAGGSSTSEHVKVQQSIAFRRKLIPVIFALNRGLIILRYGGNIEFWNN